MNTIPKSHLFTESDLRLFDLNQIYQISTIWYEKMKSCKGTFDLFVRELPEKRNFLIFGGLEEIICGIKKWKYSQEEITYLLENKIISADFAKYLQRFKLTSDVYAMPEGTVFFPNEPVLRITGPLYEVNLLTMFFLNALVSNTIFLSKFTRITQTAGNTNVFSSVIRGQSFESAMKAARAQYITGVRVISCPAFYRKYNIPIPLKPPLTTLYHAYIQSFKKEYDAMEAGENMFPNVIIAMIDTYSYKNGVKNAIALGKKLKEKGENLAGIVIDSGDLGKIAKYARKELDTAGMQKTKITLASNIDEYRIAELKKQNVPVDSFIVVTEAVTSADAPKLEAVFKLAEVDDGTRIRSTIKLSTAKLSLPGKKQVYRSIRKHFVSDAIGFDKEKLGKPLLVQVIKNGRVVYKLPSLPEIRSYVESQMKLLPPHLKSVNKKSVYRVKLSRKIQNKIRELRASLQNNSPSSS